MQKQEYLHYAVCFEERICAVEQGVYQPEKQRMVKKFESDWKSPEIVRETARISSKEGKIADVRLPCHSTTWVAVVDLLFL